MPNRVGLSWLTRSVKKKVQSLHMSAVSDWFFHYGSKPLAICQNSAIVFAPHQDDETFGCGGLIALKRKANVEVTVVFLTDGGAATDQGESEEPLVQVRQNEALAALAILGVEADRVHFLHYPDGRLNQLRESEQQAIVLRLSELLNRYQPIEVYVPHCRDHHADHEATFRLVQAAIADRQMPVELFQYAIWAFWHSPFFLKLKPKDFAEPYSISIEAVQQQKQAAIAVYQSQHGVVPQQFLEQFQKPFEVFFKTDS